MESEDILLQAIHECVCNSVIRHVLNLPLTYLLKYLTTYPFHCGADTLYFFILKREGKQAYYGEDGKHLIITSPELLGVYMLAEQDLYAPISRDSTETIYLTIINYITRTVYCPRYQQRHNIIIGEAPFTVASDIPSIAFNIPKYQAKYIDIADVLSVQKELIKFDSVEPIKYMNVCLFNKIFKRIAYVKGIMPNLWRIILQDYYRIQLLRLNIYDLLPSLPTHTIIQLNTIYPEIVRVPPYLDSLSIRLWFSTKSTRAYLLGIDIKDGLPSDEVVSNQLRLLNKLGIENYAYEITRIHYDDRGLLTGQIGLLKFPQVAGRQLLNKKDLSGKPINIYYPMDLFPIVLNTGVVIITQHDIQKLIDTDDITVDGLYEFRELLTSQHIPYLTEPLSDECFLNLSEWICIHIQITRGIPVRTKLVEVMSWDEVEY